LGIIAEIIALIIYICTNSWQAIILARALDAVAAGAVSFTLLARLQDELKEGYRGKYAGISLSLESFGKILAPVMGGILADRFFIQAPFYTAILILLVLVLLVPRESRQRIVPSKSDFNLFQNIREFLSHRELLGMGILGAVMHATMPAISIFLPLYIVGELGLGYSQVGYIYFAMGITHLLQFEFGKWADKNPRRTVIMGTLLTGALLVLISKASAYYLLLALFFIKGIGNSMWNISAWTLMSNIGEKGKNEGAVIGAYISIAKTGAFISFILSGLVVQYYGISVLFLANGILIILGSLVACPLLRGNSQR
jgi:MFS family permease